MFCQHEQIVEQKFELPVIWDAFAIIWLHNVRGSGSTNWNDWQNDQRFLSVEKFGKFQGEQLQNPNQDVMQSGCMNHLHIGMGCHSGCLQPRLPRIDEELRTKS